MLRDRTRRLAGEVVLLFFSTFLALASAEAVLRAWPSVAGRRFANGIASKYRTGPDGIYYDHPDFPYTRLMKPSFETEMSHNGYRWHHRTDAFGFRNPGERRRADVILLGDSVVYAHGLEQDAGIAARLESRTGLLVVNMARQGDSILQQVCLLNAFIGTYRPRYVVHFFFQNDIPEIKGKLLTEAAMRGVLESPEDALPCARPPDAPPPEPVLPEPQPDRRPYLLRFWAGRPSLRRFLYEWNSRLFNRPYRYAENAHEKSLEWRIMRKSLRQLDAVARRHGAVLLLAPVGTSSEPTYLRHLRIFRRVAQEEGLNLIDTQALDVPGPEFTLPGDGHLSATGSDAFATVVADAVKRFP